MDDDLLAQVPPTAAIVETIVLYDIDADRASVDDAVHAAATDAGATGIMTRADHPSNSSLQLDVSGFEQMAIAFPILFLSAAGMALYVLLTRTVFSQRGIIGTLRASGMSAVAIRRHYVSYGLWIGAIASVIGVALGSVAGALMTSAYTGALSIPDTVVQIRPLTIVLGIVFGVVAGALSATIPARSAGRVAPAEAMRAEAPMLSGGKSVFEKLVPPLSRLSVRSRMALTGIGRAKRRSLSTVLGVVLALILASGLMIDSMVNVINEQFDTVNVQDANVVASLPVDATLIRDIEAVPNVAAAEPVVTLSASITNNGDTFARTLQAYGQDTVMHGWSNPSGRLPTDGILAGNALADRIGASMNSSSDSWRCSTCSAASCWPLVASSHSR